MATWYLTATRYYTATRYCTVTRYCTATRLLLLYEKQLRTGVEGETGRQGLELLYMVAASAEEEWLGCPPLR